MSRRPTPRPSPVVWVESRSGTRSRPQTPEPVRHPRYRLSLVRDPPGPLSYLRTPPRPRSPTRTRPGVPGVYPPTEPLTYLLTYPRTYRDIVDGSEGSKILGAYPCHVGRGLLKARKTLYTSDSRRPPTDHRPDPTGVGVVPSYKLRGDERV